MLCYRTLLCHNLLSFVQFKKPEKYPWSSVIFSKATLLKLTLLHGRFSRFLNFTNSIKSRKASQMDEVPG